MNDHSGEQERSGKIYSEQDIQNSRKRADGRIEKNGSESEIVSG
jgi:hypothetical protein